MGWTALAAQQPFPSQHAMGTLQISFLIDEAGR